MENVICCLNCGVLKKPSRNSFGKYCSNRCQAEYQYKMAVDLWLKTGISPSKSKTSSVIRRWLNEKNCSCWKCGITEWNNAKLVFEVDHIDGNSTNNSSDNLQLLCPNCHSQTSTYKGKNKGKGRYTRRKRYALSKSY